jgi:hypothetical protein
MTILADSPRPSKQPRGRSTIAIEIREARQRNELTPEDVAERVHAWFHAHWKTMWPYRHDGLETCQHESLCRDIRRRAKSALNRLERLTQATHDKDPDAYAFDIRSIDFAVTVAHADASIEDVYVAALDQHAVGEAERRQHAADQKEQRARDLVAQVKAGRLDADLDDDAEPADIALRMLAEEMAA